MQYIQDNETYKSEKKRYKKTTIVIEGIPFKYQKLNEKEKNREKNKKCIYRYIINTDANKKI